MGAEIDYARALHAQNVRGPGNQIKNMADETTRIIKRRGRYREYMRHSNPYKFPAARSRKGNLQKANQPPAVTRNGFNRCESDVQEMLCEQPRELRCTVSTVELLQAETTNTSPGEVCSCEQIQDMDDSSDFENKDDLRLSEDERLDFAHNTYERFVKDDDACSDFFSDSENSESDSEFIQEQCETEADDILYSGAPIKSSTSVVLLLSFVFKHNLTREASSDLLAVIEAHCPRPNNCKTTTKKLFEFVSRVKGDIVKHYFCGYCKAYYGKDVNGNCNICGRSIQKTGGFFIEVPIANQLQKFFTGKCIWFFYCVEPYNDFLLQ